MTYKEWKIARAAELGITVANLSVRLSQGRELLPEQFKTIKCIDCGAEICRKPNANHRKRCDKCSIVAKRKSQIEWQKSHKASRCECGQGWKVNSRYGCEACNRAFELAHPPKPTPATVDDFGSDSWIFFLNAWKRLERLRMGGLRRRFNQFDRAL